MGFHDRAGAAPHHKVQCQASNGVGLSTPPLDSRVSGVTNHASLFGSLMGESGFGRCQENICLDCIVPNKKFDGGGINGIGNGVIQGLDPTQYPCV